jgi:hypothetical protein
MLNNDSMRMGKGQELARKKVERNRKIKRIPNIMDDHDPAFFSAPPLTGSHRHARMSSVIPADTAVQSAYAAHAHA